MPISSGSQPATLRPRKMPSGESPRFSASLPFMTTQAEAPSESWLALPAVMKAPGPRTGSSFARPSGEVSGRLPSSRSSVTACSLISAVALSCTSFVVGGGGAQLALQRILVLRLARDAVALRHDLGGVDHRQVDLGLVLLEPLVVQ